jgi:type I restriction enzyme S subunit
MTKKVEKRVPDIRFKGFTDDWEQRELKDVSKRILRKNKDLQSTLPLTISAQDGLVDQTTYFNKQVASKQLRNYLLLLRGEFAYNKSYSVGYPYGAIKRLNKYDQGVLSTLYLAFKPQKVNSGFLQHYYDTDKWYREIYQNSAEGARNHGLLNISADDFFHTKLKIPGDNKEQVKIAEFFDYFDNFIDLQQKKLEQLRLLKKAMLQQIFTDTAQPQSRFKGFNDNWEQRKFGDLVDRKSKQTKSTADIPSVEYDDIISGQGKLNKNVSTKEVMKNGIKFDDTNVLYGKLRPYLHNWLNASFTGVAVGDWWVFKPVKISKNYLYYLIQTKKYDNVANLSSGSKMPRSDWNLVSNTLFGIPNTKEEQKKIGVFLSDLDSLIALHQRKLNNFKQIKKFLLQNLFI